MRGRNNFTLQRQGTNDWCVVGEKFPVDAGGVQQFIKDPAGLRIAEFVKDVVDRAGFAGLWTGDTHASNDLAFGGGDTNSVIVQLSFGTNQNNESLSGAPVRICFTT